MSKEDSQKSVAKRGEALRAFVGWVGIGSLSYGAWLYNPPLGFAIAGLCLIGTAYLAGEG